MKSGEALLAVRSKMERYVDLSEEHRRAFLALPTVTQSVRAGAYVVREGDPVRSCTAILSGFAYRHKVLSNGARQIISVHVAGDIVDIQDVLFRRADNNIQMLTAGELALVAKSDLEELAARRPLIQRAFWLSTLIDGSIANEWIANVGRRDAPSRVSHLLCEFAVRLKAIGMMQNDVYDLPMTQEQIGDATGLTPVHINRTLRQLRDRGLITADRRTITIEDWGALVDLAGFDARYLHQEGAAALC